MTASRSQRGLALVSVLWGVAILSIVAAAMLTSSLTTAYVGRNVWNATRGATLDEAAINRTILALMDSRAKSQPRVDGAARIVTFDGSPVKVWIQDESGRINLNLADKDTLQSLFQSAGIAQDAAATLSDRIIALRAPSPAGSPAVFHTVDDVRRVPGMTDALYARILPLITVYGRNGAVNTAVAPRAVLLALPNANENSVADLLRDRDAMLNANPPSGALAAPNATFMITAESRVDGARAIRVAVVQFTGDETKPYWLLSWQ